VTQRILIKNPLCCVPMTGATPIAAEQNIFSGGYILIEDQQIKVVGKGEFRGKADRVIDASRMIVLPGLINTHHHFYQTLTRAVLATQTAPLFEWLTTNYEIWRELTSEAVEVSARIALVELLKSGCTTTSDHLYLFPASASAELLDAEIVAAQELGMRFHATRGAMSLGRSDGGLPPDEVVQSDLVIAQDIERLVKKYHDSSPGAMTRIALAPCSPFSVSPELMRLTVRLADEYDLRLHTHLAETRDEEQFCLEKFGMRPFALMQKLGWISSRVWFAHAIFLNDEEIAQLGAAGCGIAHCPTSNMRLGSGIARIREMLKAGVQVSLAVDGSASNDSSNMLNEARNALLLSRLRQPSQWLSVAEVLWCATRGGAAVLGRNAIGQIAPGMQADLTLIALDRIEFAGAQADPVAALLFCVPQNPVDMVIINGQIIVEQGRVVGLDEAALIRRQQQISESMLRVAEDRTGFRLFR